MVYTINAQIKISSGISVSTNFGIRIEKNGVVIAEENYLSVVVTTTNVSSPYRRISTTVDLAKNDTITFVASTGLASLDVLGDREHTYCSIYQIR